MSLLPSMLYQVLPTMVSNRIPTLPSIRRSLSDIRRRDSHSKAIPLIEIPGSKTPPPDYSSRPESGSVTPSQNFGRTDFDFSDDTSERPDSSSNTLPPLFTVYETNTKVNWKYASQGLSLMTQALRESSAPLYDTDETSSTLTRQLYVHGITYLLRGLPTELTPEETLSLQAAVPQSLLDLASDSRAHALVPVSQHTSVSHEGPRPQPTTLHRITATIVFQTFILIQFLLPYIKLFAGHAYQFERKHQITKRVVNTGVTTMDELGRTSLKLSRSVCQMNDGKVGQAINDMTIWWVRSVTGGVQEGFAEGMSVLGSRSECS